MQLASQAGAAITYPARSGLRVSNKAVRSLFHGSAAAFIGAALLLLPAIASAATLSFSPATGSYGVGDEFTVEITVDPGTDSINAADGTVSFDNTLLTLESYSETGSVFSLWTSNPVISQSAGTFTFSGGTPTAFSTSGTVLSLKFKALAMGTAQVSFTKASILAADGKGTNVYQSGTPASYTIGAAAPAAAPTTPDTSASDNSDSQGDVVDTGPPPIAPTITSPTFPNATSWYATSTAVFMWDLPPDATGVRTLLSTSDNATPTKVFSADTSSSTVTNIQDGTSYFYVQIQNASGWGDIAKREVLVDTAPPEEFTVSLAPTDSSGVPKLAFEATDTLSGVDHYEILIGTSTDQTVAANDITNGTYPVPPQGGGKQAVTVRAYDLAGNMREASSTLDLPKVATPVSAADASASGTAAPSSPWTIDRILNILFAFVLGAVYTWMRYSRKTAQQNRLNILKRMAEVGDKNDRVFSAMREEFEQMVNDFDKRPQLTPEERAFLEDVKEVLDVSEELVDSGMDDLKKMLRGEAGA